MENARVLGAEYGRRNEPTTADLNRHSPSLTLPARRADRAVAGLVATLLGAWLLVSSSLSHALCRAQVEVCASGPWLSATSLSIEIETPGSSDKGVLAFAFPEPGTVSIDSDLSENGALTRSRVLLLDERVLLTKGVDTIAGRETDAVDAPMLLHQLVVALLATGFPEGPNDLRRRSIVDVEETRRGISVATSSASGFYRAPWRANVQIERTDAQTISYAFDIEYSLATGARRNLSLKGTWSKSFPPPLDPAMPLAGWATYTLENYALWPEGPQNAVPLAKPLAHSAATLRELRQTIRRR